MSRGDWPLGECQEGRVRNQLKSRAMKIMAWCSFPREERGASLVEYTFLLILVVVVAIVSLRYFGVTVSGSFGNSGNSVNNAIINNS